MIGITLPAEQVRTAPPEIRRWIEAQLQEALGIVHAVEPAPEAPRLAACSPAEAAEMLSMLQGDYLAQQVLFELGRDSAGPPAPAPLYRIPVGDLLRHTRLGTGDRLAACLGAITAAFRQVKGDPQAALCGFDQAGNVYVHLETHRSIHQLWQEFLAAQMQAAASVPAQQPVETVAAA